jgi:hypothetical protein
MGKIGLAAGSITKCKKKCKKRSMMLPEIESVRVEQLCGAHETQGLGLSGVQFPGNRIQLYLGDAT